MSDGRLPSATDASVAASQEQASTAGVDSLDYKKMYDDLQQQFNESRTAWLQEISEHRNRARSRNPVGLQELVDRGMDHDVYRFIPKESIVKENREYFEAALEESLRMALAADTNERATEEQLGAVDRVAELEKELEDCREELEELKEANESLERTLFRRGKDTREFYLKTVKILTEERDALQALVDAHVPRLEAKLRALRITEEEIQSEEDLDTEEVVRRWLKSEVERLRQTSAEVARLSHLLEERNDE